MLAAHDALAELTSREIEVLSLIAAGRSDLGISAMLFVTRKTVEFHTQNIFRKLGVPAGQHDNRRVHAVLTFLHETG
jgi:DNA-binding NarL/FixJ family response regulator